jgi:hypothetical protein
MKNWKIAGWLPARFRDKSRSQAVLPVTPIIRDKASPRITYAGLADAMPNFAVEVAPTSGVVVLFLLSDAWRRLRPRGRPRIALSMRRARTRTAGC